ncbi:exopolyphosphatase [Neosynechococcus sphagnicola]|uniref:exopolyphosphatase n=1 Tax=Neosynechococcus sphagnicola TaxID=1501145 RepID=UPI000AA2B2E6|nr:exopolyphosphatase [Neosynechococcus sphagnicola]
MSSQNQYRLVTRSDFDGLVCAVLLKELNMIDEIKFVHPKDMQDGKVEITSQDIITNLPYVEGAHLVFDHHYSEILSHENLGSNYILEPYAPSAARVVFNHFGGKSAFPRISLEMMAAVDKADSGQFTEADILEPEGWVLLNFIMDPRTGLGRFKEFNISNYQLMMDLIDYCKNHTVDEILELPDVRERTELYFAQTAEFKQQLQTCGQVYGNLVVLDFRQQDIVYAGNRFMIYALFPECNISIHVLWGLKQQNTVLAVGKSIFDRTSQTNIGELMTHYGRGGASHGRYLSSCQ